MQFLKPYEIGSLKLKNRIVMAPMCMYSSNNEGLVKDFHRVHYGTRAIGGTGLIIQEATAVTPQGRISSNDLGIWENDHIPGLTSIVNLIHEGGAAAGIQLAHAGRKCEAENETTIAPSALSFSTDYRMPEEMTIEQINETIEAFRLAASRADQAGYDLLEIHGAHGYLIHEFLSPLSNQRSDQYGGSLINRTRFLIEIISAIRSVWPEPKPLIVRLSASDYLQNGIDLKQTMEIINLAKASIDGWHISSGGLLNAPIKTYPGYQVGMAETIRHTCQVPVIAVGLINSLEQVEEIIGNGRADLVALGRELLRNPYWPIRHLAPNTPNENLIPEQYLRGWSICPPQN
ncbi:MAG: NADPH dehydrogenase NamA [Eubacteriales bacterium]|jgi:NADPH2 dehydrogenase|nr:NADPH dehydrogenase NamA [Eubacteriales bacterium]MDD3198267.1 NADPH dehydrogenase NamA [Eubacteriales bacterium]MDD4683312.1 NADPH dehydrogenase NamA [Eubacteriales bacterium]